MNDVTSYIINRPHNAHKALPVHLSRRNDFQSPVQLPDGRTVLERRHSITWIGSFATPELALGRQLVLEGKL